jgi:membrane protein
MGSLKTRLAAAVARLRKRSPLFDHLLVMLGHYGSVNGNAQAGAVTYFGFLSFFPILALGFFVVGVLAHVDQSLKPEMHTEISRMLPGVVGPNNGEIPFSTFENYAGAVGIVGLVGVLYSGLGWLSGMRAALEIMFAMPRRDQPNFLFGKLRDLSALCGIGLTLMLSVALSGAVAGFSGQILSLIGFDAGSFLPNLVLWLLAHSLAILASAVLLLTMFRLLAQPHVPRRALAESAVLGALGFELLKGLATLLIAQTQGQPAFQAFGVTLILVIWINYFSRIVMYAAAWAFTHPLSVAARGAEYPRAPGAVLTAGATS